MSRGVSKAFQNKAASRRLLLCEGKWLDSDGVVHKLEDLDRAYLNNILWWLRSNNKDGINCGNLLILEEELKRREEVAK